MKNQVLWIIFGIIFFLLFLFHSYLSSKKIKKIENKARVKKVMGINLGISEFIVDFGEYIDEFNRNSRLINILTALGYLFASLTAFYSYYLSL